jgi:hypothetical protein
MIAEPVPNLFYAFGIPVICMAASGLISLVLFKALGRIFRG